MIEVFILAAVRLYGEGLARVLRQEAGIDVVGVAADCDEAVRRIQALGRIPDVAVMDGGIQSALSGMRTLREKLPAMRVLSLAVAENEADVISWAEAGVAGFVGRSGTAAELVDAIRCAARDETPCSPRTAAALLRRVASLADGPPPGGNGDQTLTARELEIGWLLRQGLSNREIADRLCIEVPTVKNHVHHILEKLRVRRRGEAAAVLSRVPRQ